ncbi:MAG: class I SAM-dependent methyltransferase [Candidatus Rokuibacteriota bacterium]
MKDPRHYYDDFSTNYDAHRDAGYHAYIDDFEADCVRHWMPGGRVLEVGCGTGQILQRVRRFAPAAVGVDLSHGMLEHARGRGLPVAQASALELPFPAQRFDLVYSFKVLPHIPNLGGALREIERVLVPGGVALLEFYNPNSLRGAWKKLRWWKARVGTGSHDRQVYTAYHTPTQARAELPPGLRPVGRRGAVVLTPHAALHRVPVMGRLLRSAEFVAGRGPAADWAGFHILAARKQPA